MTTLHLGQRCKPRSSKCSCVPRPRKWPGLRLEPLEERVLLTQNSTALVGGLYQLLLNRMPQGGEASAWLAGLQSGSMTPSQVALGILHSPEFDLTAVQQKYNRLLNRAPEAGAAESWLAVLQTAASTGPLGAGILASPEYFARHDATARQWLTAVYQDVLGRAPDGQGLPYWTGLLAGGASRSTVVQGILNSHEAHARAATDAYHMLLGREPESAGLAAWTGQLDGVLSPEQLVTGFVAAPELAGLVDSGRFPANWMATRLACSVPLPTPRPGL